MGSIWGISAMTMLCQCGAIETKANGIGWADVVARGHCAEGLQARHRPPGWSLWSHLKVLLWEGV